MNKKNKTFVSIFASTILLSSIYADETKKLNDVIITAQKVEQNLKDVSASITVFDEFEIEDRNIEKVSDFTQYIPNFLSFQTAGLNGILNPSLRGISATAQSSMIAVPIIIDGVPLTASMGYDMSLLNIKSIEVLRGPQGTLYGAGAEAGAINIVTKKPTNEIEGKIALQFGSDNKKEFLLSTSGPIIKDKFYIAIAGKYYEKEGFIKNLTTGKVMNDKENKYGRLNFRYTPNDNLDISLISTKSKRDDGSNNLNLLKQKREVTSNLEGFNDADILTHALKFEYIWDDYTFESITSKRDYDMIFQNDFDFSSASKFHQTKSNYTKTLTQEFRLSKKSDNFTWLLGLYADDTESGFHAIQDKATPMGLMHIDAKQDLTSKNLSTFIHSKYDINSKFSLVTGIRYDKVKKTLIENAKNINLEDSYKELSPKVSLEYHIDDNMMTYITIAKGFNPGGFNPHSTDASKKGFGSEKLTSYEVGLKSSFFDNRISANIATYYIDLSNTQTVHYVSPTNFYMSNVASATSKGFELELKALVTENISIFANYGYNDITFDDFNDKLSDYSGNTKPYAPKYNYSLGAQYRSNNGIYARADILSQGKMYTDNANNFEKEAYELVNVKLGYEMDDFDIYLYGKNIFDKDHSTHGFSNKFTVYSEPRELGVQLTYRF